MDNNIDIKEELKVKNQEMLLNKKIIDLETSMESLIVFFSNYSINLSNEINNHICLIKGVDTESEQSKIMLNTINGFLSLLSNKLKELILKKVEKIKEKLNNVSNEEYNKELRYMSIFINNQLLEFYGENIDMLIGEITSDVDEIKKDRISNYLFEIINGKMMNMLRDKFMYSIMVISNNGDENNLIIQEINEKTIK